MTITIPRFQGNAIEKNGGWTFEFIISMLGEEKGILYGCHNIYATKYEAIKHLKIAIQDIIKHLSENLPYLGISEDYYIDIKTNATRRWDKKDQQ